MWSETIEEVQKCQQAAKANGYTLWFRGQREASWPLRSSMHRRVIDSCEAVLGASSQSKPEAEMIQLMREAYKSLFHRFKGRAIGLLAEQERTDWGLVFAMQHLGLPTRLLDWTESFTCALYFAQWERKPSDDAAIFLFTPEQHNREVIGNEGVVSLGGDATKRTAVETHFYHPGIVCNGDDMETLAVEPELTNSRMVAQRSAFTLCGASFQPLEQKYSKFIRKIILSAKDFNEAQAFLDLAGQTHFGYFPDLEGLRDYLIAEMVQEVTLAKDYQTKRQQ